PPPLPDALPIFARATGRPGACDARRLYACARRRVVGTVVRADRPSTRSLLLRVGRRFGRRDRAEDEFPLLAQQRSTAETTLSQPCRQLSRRNGRGAGGHGRGVVQGRLCAVVARRR